MSDQEHININMVLLRVTHFHSNRFGLILSNIAVKHCIQAILFVALKY